MKYQSKLIIAAMLLIPAIINAENFVDNGSFEKPGLCSNYENLQKKGFKLNFKKKAWVKQWIINGATTKADISIISAKDAADGKAFLQVKDGTHTHIYVNKKFPGEFPYTISVKAKSPTAKGEFTITTYIYISQKNKFIGGKMLKKITLTKEWQTLSMNMPKLEAGKHFMIAFSIKGDVDVDDLVVDMKE